MASRSSLTARLPHLLLPLIFAWCFYASLSHEAARRILALETVENYGFAVYNQLLWNFSHYGRFFQTIHRGYADNWMWSGHKEALLPLVGWLYGLKPGPLWLAQIQIGAVALGAFPVYALGRLYVGGLAGGLLGLVLYFGYPPLYYMALSDYQGIMLAIPLLLLLLYQCRQGWAPGFALAALAVCTAREELVLMVALVGFSTPGDWRRRLRFGLTGTAIAALYLATIYALFHQDMLYESSAQTQLKAMLSTFPPSLPPILYDKLEAFSFYRSFLFPVEWLALLSPLTVLPGLGAFAFHLTVNPGNGVDRVWSTHAHIHHLAPLIPLLVTGTLASLGVLLRRLGGAQPPTDPPDPIHREPASMEQAGDQRPATPASPDTRTQPPTNQPRANPLALAPPDIPVQSPAGSSPRARLAVWITLGVVASVCLAVTVPTVRRLQVPFALTLRPTPTPIKPEWKLVRLAPVDAVIATDQNASLAISSRREAYTYNESLLEKVHNGDPLARVDYLLVNRRDTDWQQKALARPGATQVGESPEYLLIKLR